MNSEFYLHRCIQLAKLGLGQVSPNPLVGCVIVHENTVIGEGYHAVYGGPHAEVNAINQVKDKSLLRNATIYVSLEPCAHFGKTPPCVDLILSYNFKKVVIGSLDPFEKVNGKGIEKLIQAGIEVEQNVLEKECKDLNKRFFTFHKEKRPYITLKWAESKDGFIDKIRCENDKNKINWITQEETKSIVHKWRSEEHAILVGKNTIENDNPSLTVRNVVGNHPIRVVLDANLQLNSSKEVFNTESKTLVLNLLKNEICGNVQFIQLDKMDVNSILTCLYENNIQSVFVEGGAKVLTSFIEADLWDEARVLQGNVNFENGLKAPKLSKLPHKIETFLNDKIYYYFCK